MGLMLLHLTIFAAMAFPMQRRIGVGPGDRVTCRWPAITSRAAAPRYGPPIDRTNKDGDVMPRQGDSVTFEMKKRTLKEILALIDDVNDPQHIPSILTNNVEALIYLMDQDGATVMSTIADEIRDEHGEDAANRAEEVLDLVLSFAEQFVEEARSMEDGNRRLLGRILLTMSDKTVARNGITGYDREEALDKLFADERDNLTPGFLRHLDSECERISSAPTMTPESSRLMETLRVIQVRVLEELGNDLGRSAQVLGQLIAYDSSDERLAVLEAGLAVQGVDFAREMRELTGEALEGFTRVPGGADPGLIHRITEIHERLGQYLASGSSSDAFQ